MALSAFADQHHPPDSKELRASLGDAFPAWTRLIELVKLAVPQLNEVWGFASKSTGWGLRLREGERVLLYMTPCRGHFLFSVVLGENAVARATAASLPVGILDAIDAAPRYAEGRGVRIEVREAAEVAALAELAAIKRDTGSGSTRKKKS